MRSSKFFLKLSVALILVALLLVLFGIYFVLMDGGKETCEPSLGICSPFYGVTILYTIVVIGCIAFSFLAYGHSREVKKREDRERHH